MAWVCGDAVGVRGRRVCERAGAATTSGMCVCATHARSCVRLRVRARCVRMRVRARALTRSRSEVDARSGVAHLTEMNTFPA